MTSGADRIMEERTRQEVEEGFDVSMDAGYTNGELLAAAKCYIDVNERLTVELPERRRALLAGIKDVPGSTMTASVRALAVDMEANPLDYITTPVGWPWLQGAFKPSTDLTRNLEKAGALIAAEIDRLQAVLDEGVN